VNNPTEFTTTFNFYLEGEKDGDHVDVINCANEIAQSLSDILINVKVITRLTQNDGASDKLVAVAKMAGDVGLRFFLNLQSYELDLLQPKAWKDVPLCVLMDSRGALSKLSESVESVVAKRDKANDLARANGCRKYVAPLHRALSALCARHPHCTSSAPRNVFHL